MPSRTPPLPFLQLHTVVDQPLTADARGRISCRPLGQEPIHFSWTGPRGEAVSTDASGSEAYGVEVGRYRVEATDATGARADVLLDVEPVHAHAVVVREYRVTSASTSSARDGSVEAVGANLEGRRFLWTHGSVTDGPVLRDVPCGTYAAVPLPRDAQDASTLVHECPPACVTVARAGRWGGVEDAAREASQRERK